MARLSSIVMILLGAASTLSAASPVEAIDAVPRGCDSQCNCKTTREYCLCTYGMEDC
ncbi:unnamed protein product [Cercospora beticola]|nr:unnamed protein product [Cercospora beticola]